MLEIDTSNIKNRLAILRGGNIDLLILKQVSGDSVCHKMRIFPKNKLGIISERDCPFLKRIQTFQRMLF